MSGGKPSPKPRVVDRDAVEKCVSAVPPGSGVVVYALDSKYWVVGEDAAMDAVRSCHTDALKYVADRFDCDKFARTLYADLPLKFQLNSVGFVLDWSGRHSYNLLVVDEKPDADAPVLGVRWVEPQSDAEIKLHSKPYYDLGSGIVIL